MIEPFVIVGASDEQADFFAVFWVINALDPIFAVKHRSHPLGIVPGKWFRCIAFDIWKNRLYDYPIICFCLQVAVDNRRHQRQEQ